MNQGRVRAQDSHGIEQQRISGPIGNSWPGTTGKSFSRPGSLYREQGLFGNLARIPIILALRLVPTGIVGTCFLRFLDKKAIAFLSTVEILYASHLEQIRASR